MTAPTQVPEGQTKLNHFQLWNKIVFPIFFCFLNTQWANFCCYFFPRNWQDLILNSPAVMKRTLATDPRPWASFWESRAECLERSDLAMYHVPCALVFQDNLVYECNLTLISISIPFHFQTSPIWALKYVITLILESECLHSNPTPTTYYLHGKSLHHASVSTAVKWKWL